MKKVFISLLSLALLFSACGSDEDTGTGTNKKNGELKAKISFDAIAQKATSLSTAIPKTSWDNVNEIQMFLYDKTSGEVAFSRIFDPQDGGAEKIFKWTNVPEGTYELALVANINSNIDPIATSLDYGVNWIKLDQYNVENKKINSEIFIDLKKSAFPAGHDFENGDVAYAPTSEVFTAYKSDVTIVEGVLTDLATAGELKLRREISLMRVRIDKTDKEDAPKLSDVDFAHAKNFIVIHNMPVGMGLKLGSFAGGVYASSDDDRIMIGAEGTGTFKTANPAAADYNPVQIIDTEFTLWNDIRVLPNASRAEGKASDADATASRKYYIVLAGWAPKDYEYADGSIAPVAQPVYWFGTINGVFSPNIIREVNLTITSKGYTDNPYNPEKTGGLNIKVGSPEDWNTNIEREDHNI
ncbi:MAG: FimB/Mfa2 family fimbrial subunit [Prevotella sp.]|jgi:hypothetical protein|nr:FimB/Mfa2 family fimbrial subunit [Prevotella sp.]